MNTKLKIDLSLGILEVEGSESFVKHIYDDFKDNITTQKPAVSTPPAAAQTPHNPAPPKKPKAKKPAATNTSTAKLKTKKIPALLKDLDLSGSGDKPSLKDFYSDYDHKTNFERNLIFTYYLKEVLNTEKVTLDHIFTCYRNVGQKIPKALEQGMRDTAKDRAWVDIDDLDDIKVPVAGMNHIEHDLAKSKCE